jgi:type III pantothenate kinase
LNLIIDIGNTRTKLFIFSNNKIIEQKAFKRLTVNNLRKLIKSQPAIDKCILSNVGNLDKSILSYLGISIPAFIELSGNTTLPFMNLYETKYTQGSDRIAAIAGARVLFPNDHVLVIDAGTTITYELLDASGTYKGGNISPGIDTRFKALHQYTRKLPLLSRTDHDNILGKNTNEAIVSGVITGIIYEIEGYIDSFNKLYENLKIILTGGDSEFLAGKIKNFIFAESNLVAIGLNSILEHNVKK